MLDLIPATWGRRRLYRTIILRLSITERKWRKVNRTLIDRSWSFYWVRQFRVLTLLDFAKSLRWQSKQCTETVCNSYFLKTAGNHIKVISFSSRIQSTSLRKHVSSFFTVFIVCVGNWQWGELKWSNPIKRKERPNWMGKPPWPILWQFLHVRIFCLLNPCRRVLGFPMGWIVHRLVRNTLYGLGLVGLT